MTSSIVRYSQKEVLVIDDFSQYAYALRGMMITLGCVHVDLAYNGDSAIQACRERKYDIILADYNLGDSKDGQQILEELHSFNLLKDNGVYIIVTAENARDMVMGAIEFEPDGYLTKPFNAHSLKNRLDKSILKKEVLKPVAYFIRKKKYREALNKCDEIIEQFPRYNMSCLRQKYVCLKALKEYKLALHLTTKLIHQRPIAWAMLGVGEIYFEQGEFERAEAAFIDLVNEFPLVPEGYDWLAKIQYQLGHLAKAQETVSKAVKVSPRALQRQRVLGQLAEENYDFDTMSSAYRQAVKLGEHSAFATPEEFVKLTKSIGMQLRGVSVEDRKKLVNEAETTFAKLNHRFDGDTIAKFRGAVAHADFSSVTNDKRKVTKHLKSANRFYNRIEDLLGAKVSVEVSDSLKHLGEQKMVENILEEAVEQHFDNPKFMKHVAKLTNNKELLIKAKKADLYNKKAMLLFTRKDFVEAVECFDKATEIAPNNVDINLNHAQALLKIFISSKEHEYLEKAELILTRSTGLSITDPRYQRYLELVRYSQLIRQRL